MTVQGQDKDQDKTALAKTKTSKNGLKAGFKTKTGLKDYITVCPHKQGG